MLVDVYFNSSPMTQIIAQMNGNILGTKKIATGIYEIGHFSFDYDIEDQLKNKYPDFSSDFGSYGVCDNHEQILNTCPEIQNDKNRKFVISITKISKKNQPNEGGWRWHKWGEYIGTQESTREYLFDEPIIEEVFCYHVYEVK